MPTESGDLRNRQTGAGFGPAAMHLAHQAVPLAAGEYRAVIRTTVHYQAWKPPELGDPTARAGLRRAARAVRAVDDESHPKVC